MTVYYRVYSSTADSDVTASNATYLTARASTAATSTGNLTVFVGQRLNAGTYTCAQAFFQFDTSAVPTGGVVSITIDIGSGVDAGAVGDSIEIREVSTVANKIAGASISALTLLGSVVASASWLRQTRLAVNVDSARSATHRVLLNSARETAATPPTVSEYFGSGISMADQTGTTRDPFIQYDFAPVWKYVAVSGVVSVTAAAHTLTEPTGAAQGDLLVACIASRIASTTSITLPSAEWTLVSEQKTNNILTTSSAVASGMMAYCIRGASAPSYAFTHPTAPSVALGRVVAYRNVNTVSPKDTQTSFTTAIATTAVSGAGLTTAEDDELIVAMFAGGQEAAVTVFAAATSPTADSGTNLNVIVDPMANTWSERADSASTTGADTSLSIFDAVKTAAGATGNLTCTASVAASHVVVAGAFRLAPPRAATIINQSFAVTRAASW